MKRLPPENDLHGDRKGHAEVGVEHHALVDIQGRGCNDHMRTTPEMKDRAFRHEDPKLTPYSRAEGNWSACGIFDDRAMTSRTYRRHSVAQNELQHLNRL